MRWVVLLAAILVWVNLYAFITRTETFSAPLLVEHLALELSIAEPITTVAAAVSGGLRDIARLSAQNLQFSLDASSISTPGRYHLKITPRLVPVHVKIISVELSELDVTIENTASKVLDVMAVSQGAPNDKYSVDSLIPSPAQVTAFGAPTLLSQLSTAQVKVDVSGRRASFSVPTEVVVLDGQNQPIHSIRVDPKTIKVGVNIVAGASVRNLGLKPAFTGELPGGFWVQEVKFEPIVIQVRGPQKILDAITSLISTPITLTDQRGDFNEQVAVNLPSGVELVGENLVLAHIILGSAEGTRQFDVVPQYVNVTEGFGVTTINPASVQVVILGNPKIINQLNRTDVKLNLDLSGALSGSNSITVTPAMFSLPSNFQVVSFTPDKVEVVMSRS